MGNRFLRIATLYFLVGISMGIYMAATQNFEQRPVHVHVNLLGWVSLTLFGLIYRAIPAAATTGLAKVHFWTYNVALPLQMVSLAFYMAGNKALEPALGLTSAAVAVAVICFAVNLWRHTGDAPGDAASSATWSAAANRPRPGTGR